MNIDIEAIKALRAKRAVEEDKARPAVLEKAAAIRARIQKRIDEEVEREIAKVVGRAVKQKAPEE